MSKVRSMHTMLLVMFVSCTIVVLAQSLGMVVYLIRTAFYCTCSRENHNLRKVYSIRQCDPCWVVITGGSSGQGKEFAMQLARKGFDIVLIGSKRSHQVAEKIVSMGQKCKVIVKDFGRAFEDSFFDDIEAQLRDMDIAMLINNVGHRSAWQPYHTCPLRVINNTISCGTIVQAQLTRMLLPRLISRMQHNKHTRSAVVFITAQCMHPNVGMAMPGISDNMISIPYMAVYEASNAFGFYHACSLINEYKHIKRLDMLNITPGAVVTSNTAGITSQLPFCIDSRTFVRNIIRMLGGKVSSGTLCAHFGHAFSMLLVGFCPWIKDIFLPRVGLSISESYMKNHECCHLQSKYRT